MSAALPPLPWGDDFEAWLEIRGTHEVVEVLQAYAQQARADLEAENKQLLDTIDAIYIYANDTLSGRTDGPDDREWQRAAVVEIRNRSRKHATVDIAIAARAALKEQP